MATQSTPLMRQYFKIKEQYPDFLLFFQVGDFYELFFEDAKIAASYLAIALTKRGKNNHEDIPLCGVPVHALNHYLVKLIKGGFKVALCDQTSKPEPGKIVERRVQRVLTPATLTDVTMLDEKSASYLATLYSGKQGCSVIFSELLTAQLFATTVPAGQYRMLQAELIRFFPDEVIVPFSKKPDALHSFFKQEGYLVSMMQTDKAEQAISTAWLEEQFASPLVQKIVANPSMLLTFQLLHRYLEKHQQQALNQFNHIHFYEPEDYLVLDAATQSNLEIVKNNHESTRKNTLFSVVDRAKTAMGSRTIKKWLQRPLVQRKTIEYRHETVELFVKNLALMQNLEELLLQLPDIERIIGRIALRRTQPQDYIALKQSLCIIPSIKKILAHHATYSLIQIMLKKFYDFTPLYELLTASLHDNITSASDSIIKKGFDYELDKLRDLLKNGQQALLKFERSEIEATSIKSLKIGYNQVTGYYLEVTKPNVHLVPKEYQPLHKLASRERFVTPQLKQLENDLNKARTQTDAVEHEVYKRVQEEVLKYLAPLRKVSQTLAYLDALFGFAFVAYNNQFCRPCIHEKRDIIIKKGRHPVVEETLPASFIANDTAMTDSSSLWIITGPNMGGKSTYLRQVALINLLAQCGSFVPAQSAQLPILDRIFTRIGAGDNLAQGKSTFLIEMEETAVICSQATKHSLVILDEVGRGTSTFDGMALAQSIIEYLYEKIKARCLFATHYHELTNLSQRFAGITNHYMCSTKTQTGILFLHELSIGVAQGSFGLEVARLAQLPDSVIARANQLLNQFNAEKQDFVQSRHTNTSVSNEINRELAQLKQELEESKKIMQQLSTIDLDNLTLRKAFDLIWEMKSKMSS